jgi:hypothetical protein
MSKKKGNFIEQHLDKLILGIIGLICLGLLWIYIFSNPFGPEINGRKESPGSLQSRLEQKKDRLRERIDGTQISTPVVAPDFITGFEQMLACSIPQIDASVYPLTPGIGSQSMESDREYVVPEIPALQDVKIAYIRGAAYLPTEEVTPEVPYASVETKIGDLDFVTVSARLDVKRLIQQFKSSFEGIGVRYKDPTLSTPVAARIELQRRIQKEDGSWGEWEVVPIPQTVAYRKTFENLPMTIDQLGGGGVHVQIAQYKDTLKQSSLLQPPPYDFASSRYQYWMAPQFLEEVQKLQQQQRDEAKRQQREAASAAGGPGGGPTGPGMAGEGMGPGGRQPRQPQPVRPQRPETGRGGRTPGATPDMGGEMGPGGLATDRPGRPVVRQRTMEDVYRDYQKEILVGDWWTRNEPLLVWAHDDTIQPGKIYQYRIRAGLFNPIAGRDWFRDDQQEYKNQVILWSPFAGTDSTKKESLIAAVPKMLHIFPMDISKNNPDAVSVRVSKYYYGRWRSEDFEVLPGQIIGSPVEPRKPDVSAAAGETGIAPGMGGGMEGGPMPGMVAPGFGMGGMGQPTTAQTATTLIDFTTNVLFLDILGSVDWSGSLSALRRREYNDMLYTVDGTRIDKLPIRQQNWPADLRKDYRDVQEAERESENETLVGRTNPGSMMQTPGVPGGMPPMGPGRGIPPMGGGFMGREG